MSAAENILNKLTEKECKNYNITILGYQITIPDDYVFTTIEQLDCDLWKEKIYSPEYDPSFGYKEKAIIFKNQVLIGW